MERGSWRWDEAAQALVETRPAADVLAERERRIELERRELLVPRPSIVKGPRR